jgi:ATP-binding cassette subfamily F protein uup
MAQSTILDVRGLTKRIGNLVLMEDLNFSLAEGKKVGIIAKNGAGKSTLLNILCGDEDYEAGEIVWRRDLRVGYLRQNPWYPEHLTVMEACFQHGTTTAETVLGYQTALNTPDNPDLDIWIERMETANAWDYEARIKQVLTMLKIHDFNEKIGHLSGGQLKRVALANILLTEPDLLVLDEPTNHLDLEMIEWLEHYLQQTTMSLLMVTHDRYFLDRVCNDIIELADHQVYAYHGNYSYYLEKRQERIDQRNAAAERLGSLYRKELEWMRRSPQARGHKAKYREEAFYKLEERAHNTYREDKTRLEVKSTYIGSKIFEMNYVSKAFGDKVILKDFYYNFARYEKLGIVGNNGTGKTTFIKMLLGYVTPDNGHINVGQTVRFGYYSQEGMQFNTQMKVIDAVRDIAEYVDLGHGRKLGASQFLQQFLFPPETQHNYIYKLSGGELRRLYLCTVLMQSPNFLILDEPTNDLDIVTLQVLEEYLREFEGCVIIVSHDRYFMDKVVDHVLVFQGNGIIKDFPGNYTQYRDSVNAPDASNISSGDTTTYKRAKLSDETANSAREKSSVPKQREKAAPRRLTYKEKKEYEQLEHDITALEAEKTEIVAALSSGTLSVEQITTHSKRLPLLDAELDEKSLRWLELSEIAEGNI